jgi:membrane fusion protein, multidrug efflux system
LAGLSGLVNKVGVQEGQIVGAGESLIEVVATDRIQVRIGIEPALAAELKPGHKVHLQTVQGDTPVQVEGTLKLITHRMNPANRLVEAYVGLPAGSPLVLETFVTARIGVASKQALIVPRLAVLPEEDKHILFTVVDGKAVEHEVEIGIEDPDSVELLGDAVKPGDTVVVQGNAELEKGMAVEIEDSQPSQAETPTKPTTATGSHS